MANKTVIADAGPLIAFGRINFLSLLSDILGKIVVPEAVADECLVNVLLPGAGEIQRAIHEKIIKVYANPDFDQNHGLLDVLDKSEASAIALALKLNAGLLIDEKLGRSAAKKLNLQIIGTAGVLLLAKQNKYIDKVYPIIQELKKSGYFLSSELTKEVLKRANEKP